MYPSQYEIKMNRALKVFSKGSTIKVPQHVAPHLAERWIRDGHAEYLGGEDTRPARLAKVAEESKAKARNKKARRRSSKVIESSD